MKECIDKMPVYSSVLKKTIIKISGLGVEYVGIRWWSDRESKVQKSQKVKKRRVM